MKTLPNDFGVRQETPAARAPRFRPGDQLTAKSLDALGRGVNGLSAGIQPARNLPPQSPLSSGGLVAVRIAWVVTEEDADINSPEAVAAWDQDTRDKFLVVLTDKGPFIYCAAVDPEMDGPPVPPANLDRVFFAKPWFQHDIALFKDPSGAQIFNTSLDQPVYELLKVKGVYYVHVGVGSLLTEAPTIDTVCLIEPVGACCLPEGVCLDGVTQDACVTFGGTWQGADVLCDDVTCPVEP